MRLALIPLDPTVGDLTGNAALIEERLAQARSMGVDLVAFPELCICGYPPKDLLLQSGFVSACEAAVERLGRRHTAGLAAVFGFPRRLEKAGIANALAVYRDGKHLATYDKRLLPTYDVFDEHRYFRAGNRAVVVEIAGKRIGLAVCEDLWKGEDAGFANRYLEAEDPVAELARAGAEIVVAPSASPFVLGKLLRHDRILAAQASAHGVTVASINQLGGNDDLVFDGRACIYDPGGHTLGLSPAFSPEPLIVEFGDAPPVAVECPEPDPDRLLFQALTLGIRDYLEKTGFGTALIGLSGGIDSAVTAALAVAALGPERLTGIGLPGKYSSEHSKGDARELAENLAMTFAMVPITAPFEGFRTTLDEVFERLGQRRLGERLPDLTEENLQARVRGTILMALSNRTGAILLTTGNKSEMAVGYCTLYGDMNGGLAVLSDVSKLLVYRLARFINREWEACGFGRPPIPDNTITKPPSAELAPDQQDSDSLPPYDVLDEIVERCVEGRQSVEEIVAATSYPPDLVRRIVRLIALNEYKRKQAAIGLKVTSVAFGQGRRMPIAQGWFRDSP